MFMLKWKKTSLRRMGIFDYGMLKMPHSFMHHIYEGSCRIQSTYLLVGLFTVLKQRLFLFPVFNIWRELI